MNRRSQALAVSCVFTLFGCTGAPQQAPFSALNGESGEIHGFENSSGGGNEPIPGTSGTWEEEIGSSEDIDPANDSAGNSTTTGGATPQPSEDEQESSGPGLGSESDSALDDPPTGACLGSEPVVVFVNFDGASLTQGPANAANNTYEVAREYGAYSGGERDTIVETIRSDFLPFNVCVTTSRPTQPPYEMLVITDTDLDQTGYAGLASLDCANANPAGITVVFAEGNTDAENIGHIASAGLGTSLGLESTVDPRDLSYFASGDFADEVGWVDECLQKQVAVSCNDPRCVAGFQNSYRYLTELLGVR